MRATNFRDLWFVDHVDLSIDKVLYTILVIIDAASNLIWAYAQKSQSIEETIKTYVRATKDLGVVPRAPCGDSYFHEPQFLRWYAYKNIKPIALGPNTPWPNRAEAAVKVFKKHAQILIHSVQTMSTENPFLRDLTMNHIVRKAVFARNTLSLIHI